MTATEYKRIWIARNKIRHLWHNLRSHSKARGISCTITYEEYKKLCIETGYHLHTGRSADCLSLDRIDEDPRVGYTYNNIRVVSLRFNVQRENNKRVKPWFDIEGNLYNTENPF